MKIMLIGYSGSGKTYFLGSLFKLASNPGPNGFSIEHKFFHEISAHEDIYGVISGKKQGTISSTTMNAESIKNSEWKPVPLVLAQRKTHMLDVAVADIQGQAIQAGKNVDVAKELIQIIPGYDGFIVVVDAPSDDAKAIESSHQLSQALSYILGSPENQGIPIALILNKIDLLPQASGLKAKIEQKQKEFTDSLIQQGTPIMEIPGLKKSNLGRELNPLIKPLVYNTPISEVINNFMRFMGDNPLNPYMIFPCTSLGFDNYQPNVKTDIKPYGTGAAFLWTIYAGLSRHKKKSGIAGLKNADQLARDLQKDIMELYTSGNAYCDDEEKSLWYCHNIK